MLSAKKTFFSKGFSLCMKILLAGCLVFSLFGCSATAVTGDKFLRDMTQGKASMAIVKGQTTEQEILAKFGKPRTRSQENEYITWHYSYSEITTTKVPLFHSMDKVTGISRGLAITFKDGVVYDFNYSEAVQESDNTTGTFMGQGIAH